MSQEKTYAEERLELLGITPEINSIDIVETNLDDVHGQLIRKPYPIFRDVSEGIEIMPYTIDRCIISYAKEGSSRYKNKTYCITRLKEPKVKKDGTVMKYQMPSGQPTHPFFPPMLCEAFEKKESIQTLVLTEGYFKAFKAAMHGIPCVGLPSITCMKDRTTGKLHEDIVKLIQTCKVERVIWLCDGDCIDITHDEITEDKDLYKRPYGFFRSVDTFYNLLSGFDDVAKVFAYINSRQIEGKPKGLDDLLVEVGKVDGKVAEVSADLLDFTKNIEGWIPTQYFVKTMLWSGVGKVRKHFMLDDINTFYHHHVELRPELKNKEFTFNGTKYKYNEDENICIKLVPKDAKDYFRCGTDYYKIIHVPNKYGQDERKVVGWKKDAIKDDLGKDIFKHIPKYESFCIVPDHVNYQSVIHNCYNSYSPFEHEPERGEYEVTMSFIKHIFGTKEIEWKHPKTKEVKKIFEYELGLDYLTLLYKKPQQVLPILCLVSNERQTGKTTFIKYLKLLFTGNAAVVGNQDLAADFNSHWTSKLLVMCDETKIDKQVVIEKVKSLSTSDRLMMNAKGRDQVEMEFFGKFIFNSNFEDNFANIDDLEIRFWVRKVPTFTDSVRNVDLLNDLQEEIPAFLDFLNSRTMSTEQCERHWFDTRLIKTDALTKVIQYSKPAIQKELRSKLKNAFLDFGQDTIKMDLKSIKAEFFRGKNYEDYYIEKVLAEWGYERGKPERGFYYSWQTIKDTMVTDGGEAIETQKQVRVRIGTHGRHYSFPVSDFVSKEEIESMQKDLVELSPELPLTVTPREEELNKLSQFLDKQEEEQ